MSENHSWQGIPSRSDSALALLRFLADIEDFPESKSNFQIDDISSCTLIQGRIGLSVLFAQANQCFPQEGWVNRGHDILKQSLKVAQSHQIKNMGIFNGYTGLAVVTHLLHLQCECYKNTLEHFDEMIIPNIVLLSDFVRNAQDGLPIESIDCFSGLCGIGAYLLFRSNVPAILTVLEQVTATLISLAVEKNSMPAWYTPIPFVRPSLRDKYEQLYPKGYLNLGLAHGIPGPLAFLSLVAMHKIKVQGLHEAIAYFAEWLIACHINDPWGMNWPATIPVGWKSASGFPNKRITRTAWCYGNPGIARALWLAGSAIHCKQYQDLAIQAMEAVYRKPKEVQNVNTLGFCHGIAGLLQVTLRFAHDTNLPIFWREAEHLFDQLLNIFESTTRPGFFSSEASSNEDTSLLTGTAGIALVMLACLCPIEPVWDRLFLLS